VVCPRLEPLLERDHRAAAAGHLLPALEAVERLDFLDRVARHREPQRLARDPEKVDEHLAAQQVVELVLPGAVLAHQPLQRGALVGRVVVDVHPRKACAALADQVDQPLEAGLLLRAVERPDAVVPRLAVVAEPDPAEQVLEPARRLVPGVALEVEPDVALVRLRKEREAALALEREDLVRELAREAAVELEPGLLPKLREGLVPQLGDLRLDGCRGEGPELRDPLGAQALDLRAPDPRDEREVVVGVPLLLAAREELAERAVVDRVRVGRPVVVDRVEEPSLEPPVVGEEVVRLEGLALTEPIDDVHPLGPFVLDPSELLGVEAELKQVSRLGPASELGVDDLVGAVRPKLEKVREPVPPVLDERRLVDERCPSANRLLGSGRRRVPTNLVRIRDLGDAVAERGEVSSLVLVPLPPNQLRVRVRPKRPLELPARNGEVKRSQMGAREKRVQI
jgi:hypothetical protein